MYKRAHVFMKNSLPIKMDTKVSGALKHIEGALHCLEDAPYLEMGASSFSPRFTLFWRTPDLEDSAVFRGGRPPWGP